MTPFTLAPVLEALLAVAVVLINILATVQVLRSHEMHKTLFVFAIWLVPLLGAILAFMGTRPATVAPYPIGDHNSLGPLHHDSPSE